MADTHTDIDPDNAALPATDGPAEQRCARALDQLAKSFHPQGWASHHPYNHASFLMLDLPYSPEAHDAYHQSVLQMLDGAGIAYSDSGIAQPEIDLRQPDLARKLQSLLDARKGDILEAYKTLPPRFSVPVQDMDPLMKHIPINVDGGALDREQAATIIAADIHARYDQARELGVDFQVAQQVRNADTAARLNDPQRTGWMQKTRDTIPPGKLAIYQGLDDPNPRWCEKLAEQSSGDHEKSNLEPQPSNGKRKR